MDAALEPNSLPVPGTLTGSTLSGMKTTLPKIEIIAPSMRTVGGQALHALTLTEQLRSEGYEVHLLPIDPPFPSPLKWIRRVPFLRTIVNQCVYLPSLMRLRGADVVHASSASYWSFLLAPLPAVLAGRLFGKPVVLNYHSGEAADHLAHWGALIHPWLRRVDEIVVPSEYLRKVFASFGYQARVIHNTVDTSVFRYRRRSPLRPRFVSTRCFEWYYGVEQTLLAFALLKTVFPEATLTLAGGGSQEPELRRLAAALNVTGVEFLGPVAANAIPALLDRCDIMLNSSLIDNQPLSLLEAAASGLPVVTTGVGDIPNMVEDGISAMVVPEQDPAAMARAAAFLLRHPDTASAMAARAHSRLDRFSWPRVGGQWAELYGALSARAPLDRREEKRCAA